MPVQNKSPQRASIGGSICNCVDNNLNRSKQAKLQPNNAIHVKKDSGLFILQIIPPSKLTGRNARPSSYNNIDSAMKAANALSMATGWPVTDLTSVYSVDCENG